VIDLRKSSPAPSYRPPYAAMTSETPGETVAAAVASRPRRPGEERRHHGVPRCRQSRRRPSGQIHLMLDEAFRVRGQLIKRSRSSPSSTRPAHRLRAAAITLSRRGPRLARHRRRGPDLRSVSRVFIACHRSLSDAVSSFTASLRGPRQPAQKARTAARATSVMASDSIETYSPFLDRGQEDLPLADIGDCELPTARRRASSSTRRATRSGVVAARADPLQLGVTIRPPCP